MARMTRKEVQAILREALLEHCLDPAEHCADSLKDMAEVADLLTTKLFAAADQLGQSRKTRSGASGWGKFNQARLALKEKERLSSPSLEKMRRSAAKTVKRAKKEPRPSAQPSASAVKKVKREPRS